MLLNAERRSGDEYDAVYRSLMQPASGPITPPRSAPIPIVGGGTGRTSAQTTEFTRRRVQKSIDEERQADKVRHAKQQASVRAEGERVKAERLASAQRVGRGRSAARTSQRDQRMVAIPEDMDDLEFLPMRLASQAARSGKTTPLKQPQSLASIQELQIEDELNDAAFPELAGEVVRRSKPVKTV